MAGGVGKTLMSSLLQNSSVLSAEYLKEVTWFLLIFASLYLWHLERIRRRKVAHLIWLLDQLRADVNEFLGRFWRGSP